MALLEGFVEVTSIALVLLAAGWGGYLIIWWRDSRRVAVSRTDRISSFNAGLGTLGGSAGRSFAMGGSAATLVPRNASEAAHRRQLVRTALSVLALVTLLAAVVFGPVAILVHVVVDITLGAYGYAVVQRRNNAAEREIKVRMLYPDGVTPLHSGQRQSVNG